MSQSAARQNEYVGLVDRRRVYVVLGGTQAGLGGRYREWPVLDCSPYLGEVLGLADGMIDQAYDLELDRADLLPSEKGLWLVEGTIPGLRPGESYFRDEHGAVAWDRGPKGPAWRRLTPEQAAELAAIGELLSLRAHGSAE